MATQQLDIKRTDLQQHDLSVPAARSSRTASTSARKHRPSSTSIRARRSSTSSKGRWSIRSRAGRRRRSTPVTSFRPGRDAALGRDRRDPGGCRRGRPDVIDAVRQIDAGLLNVGYVDAGPADGPAVLLLHGWPYDVHSYADVVPLLTAAGYRVIVPFLRGYIIANLEANQKPLPPKAELGWWYQYYFATERGRRGYSENRRDFNKLIWQLASPKWEFDDATYDRTARPSTTRITSTSAACLREDGEDRPTRRSRWISITTCATCAPRLISRSQPRASTLVLTCLPRFALRTLLRDRHRARRLRPAGCPDPFETPAG
jgi:hypothetical protein